ncbi:leucine-rich repeat domain-containing protein [Vibrio nigripulchritudo]|uniref:leucine-rich repeat domain-containing protein n=1 Tax=Vibrio nigripulchritudo TaxID=28173 RepID=UPI0003B1F7D5|nr:SERINE-TYPE PROTEASE INHIBITOR-RELATED [Vibrio nigripulchritudo]CCN69357.1 putative SERINE-TYPE PROTEASE INHIBITOR-RELATED [Vibrio nigripulchritudo SFn118]
MNIIKTATLIAAPLLLAACGGGDSSTPSTPSTPNTPLTPNVAPVITTNGDKVVSGAQTVILSANISDSDSGIASYKWEQVSGPAVTISEINGTMVSFVAPSNSQQQTLVFKLTVTDTQGAVSSETVTVTVNATISTNRAPTIAPIAAQTLRPNVSASITGSASDSDGHIVKYQWVQRFGTSVTLTNPDTAQLSFIAPSITQAEWLEFQLTVTDNQGATTSQQARVHVKPNQAPVLHFIGDATKDINQPVTIAASAYDRDGSIESYRWEQTAGTNVTIANPDSQTLNFTSPTLNREETLTFKVTATDNEGATGSRTVDVTVQNASNLIENLNFQYSVNKSCMDALARKNNWKFIDEVVDYGCRRSSYEPEFEKLTELTSLRINSREVNLGSHPELISLSLTDANGTITVSNLPALQRVTLRNTQGTIRITNNPQLTSIYARSISYSVDSLDLSDNPKLLTADLLRIRQIKSINISNSDAIEILKLRMSHDSPYLDVTTLTRLKELYILGTATSSQDLSKNLLLESVSIFTQTINTIALPKTNTLTSLRVHGQLQNIDLDGVTSITRLYLPNNKLTQIDLSKQTKLESLGLQDNALISLDVSNNTELTSLNVASNPLTSLDISQNSVLTGLNINNSGNANIDFSHLTELTSLSAASKNLSSFNGHNHTKLKSLDLSDNPITSFDLSAMTELSTLKLNRTQLSSLDVTSASSLSSLHASTGQLSSLTLPNEKSVLSDLRVSFNTLSDLPVTQYTNLRYLYAAGNQLTDVEIGTLTHLRDLHLGDNAISYLDISNNSQLGCVSVYDNPLTQSTKDTLDQYASESRYLHSITYTKATAIGQCGYDPYTPTP